jgi:hypothetical protein
MAGNEGQGKPKMLNEFVRPKPNNKLIKKLVPLNRYFMLKGIPVLRDIPGLRKIPGLRGLCNVRHIDFPPEDRDRLAEACGQGKVTFIVPNHPEFFTDWMIDKHLISIVAKKCACWATHGVVNGLGRIAQKFWLANNLIAQIPGNTEPSRRHSIDWALKGHGVLLHPEGAVGWHSNHIGKLYPGAFDMARAATDEAIDAGRDVKTYVAPVVWKLVFTKNVTEKLTRECRYVEGKVKIFDGDEFEQIQDRVFHIFDILLARDIEKWSVDVAVVAPYRTRQLALVKKLCGVLAKEIGTPAHGDDCSLVLPGARRWVRENKKHPQKKHVRDLIDTIARHDGLGAYAFENKTVTQEELAEHIKRLRRDYCKGNLRDILNAYFPQPAGPRTAHIRVPEPFGLHRDKNSGAGVDELRARMQATLDDINMAVKKQNGFIWYPNPFCQ